MNAALLQRPTSERDSATGRRSLAAVAAAALVGLLVAVAVAALSDQPRVTPRFPGDVRVTTSDWGSPQLFGVVGSHILHYEHDTSVQMRLPWHGGPVVDARLGDGPVHLLTVTDVGQDRGELVLTLHRDNCRYFHERAIDMFDRVTLTLAGGGTAPVLFDRPLFVKSPMLASCPDRTLDRQDDVRSEVTG